MPNVVVLGGRLESNLVGLVLGGKMTLAEAKDYQAGLSKREKMFLGPMKMLVLVGVGCQYLAKELDATQNLLGAAMLLVSYFGWLFFACLLARLSLPAQFLMARKPA